MHTPKRKEPAQIAIFQKIAIELIVFLYSVAVIPFLILETSDVTVWDMRVDQTKNGLYQYIKDYDFDVVLVAYTDFCRDNMWSFN